jgi:hypothetical protein
LNQFLGFGFLKGVQRRGVHVSPPKIGSRDGQMCFGGILRIHADLRRELDWGNLNWDFFEGLLGDPREGLRRGDQWCVFWGNLIVHLGFTRGL